ncbi:MAG: PKD domain-containing protein, partial [Bacteroidia bacterium]
ANGSITVGAVTGGTSAYTYSLNGGAFSATTSYTGLTAATYTVVVKDANGCTFSQTVAVTNIPGPTALALTTVNSTCGNANGVVNVGAVTGGTSAYTYSLNGGAFTATLSYTGLTAATYTVVVKDANGCTFSQTVALANTPGPTAQAVTNTNETCTAANGTVTIGATTGGTAAYTYSFNGGAFGATTSFTSLAAGTYTVVVNDANGCTFTQTTVVSNVPGPTALALTPVNSTCGAANGSISIGAVTGGTAPFTYSFNGSAFTATTSYPGLLAATYTVDVKDANGCIFTATSAVLNSGGPSALVLTPTNSTCSASNGVIAVGAVTGGATPYTYSIDGGAFTGTTNYTGLAAGTHTLIVKDNNGCQFTQTVTVADTPGPTALALTTVNSTCGNANGIVNVGTVTGGTSAYTYSLNGGAFTGTLSYTGLSAATYTVVVKDANGCVFTQTVVLADTPGPTALALTTVNSTCGSANGIVNVGTVTGGTSAYTYSLNGGAFSATLSYTGLSAATYTVVVKDANGCTLTQTVALADTPGPTAQAFTTVNETCTSANGSVTIGATTGGTSAYTFGFNGGAFSATTSYTGLAAGTYAIIVKDANGCQFTTSASITNTPGPTALSLSSVSSNCGNSNGSVAVGAVTGGTAPYTYSFNGSAFTGSVNYPGLLPATYTVDVKDANGCIFTQTVVVNNIGAPTASIAAQTNVSCNAGNNGAVTVSASGGAGGYTFVIAPGGTSNGTGIFPGLTAGTYTVNITDAASCPTSQVVTITEPTVLTSSITAQTNVSCNAGNNGSVSVAGAGATPAYTYSLNGGAFGASGTFGGLTAGSYTVTVKDNNGCNLNQPVTITEPTAVALTVNPIVNANCTASNGTATVNATGGTPSYTYSWSGTGGSAATTAGLPAGTYTATVTDANGCVKTTTAVIGVTPGGSATMSNINNVTCFGAANGSLTVSMGGNATAPFTYAWSPNVGTTATVGSLSPGAYSVTVTDTYGCVATTNANITEPIILNVTLASVNISCNGGSDGSINTTVTGGTGAPAYLWNPGAFTTANVSNLPVGNYAVTVTDANGCTATANQTLVQPTALAITPAVTNPHCNQADGSFTVTGSGGAGGYSFSVNGGAFGAGSFTGLIAGTYTVSIKDGNQCTQSFPVQLVDQAGPTASLTIKHDVLCNGGTTGDATVSATGGTGSYTYLWNTSPAQTTPTATNLPQGIYSVNITDQSGCVATVGVTITEPPLLVLNTVFTNPVCNGYTNGTATASAFGGTPGYSYLWSPAPAQTTATATGLGAGPYNVIVTDANGCTQSANLTLVNPPAVTATIAPTNLLCFNVCSGSATVTPSNGFAPYSYLWNDANAQTTQTATGLCSGAYTVTVTDLHGCLATVNTTLTQPPLLTSTTSAVAPVNVSCFGLCDGSGTVSPSGGVAPYAYSWNDPASQTAAVATNLCAGNYTVTVTDANGCTSPSPLTITEPNALTISATKTDASCFGVCDGTATAAFGGGTAPYGFLWQNSLSTVFNPTGLCAGTQTVTITDANGCTNSTTVTIGQPNALSVAASASNNAVCGQSNGSAQVAVTGGVGPFAYLWSNNATTIVNSGLLSGPYSVTVTDANGCIANTGVFVQDIPGPTVTITAFTNITCFGLNNGTATATIVGGAPAYTTTWLMPNLNANPVQNGTGLYPGVNYINVVDAAGCISGDTVTISEPTLLVSATNNINNATCNGVCDGNATMLANGGTPGPGYTYLWTDPSAQSVPTAVALCAGNYTCTVTDANGCTTSKPVTITEPLPLVINLANLVKVDCYGNNNAQISVAPTGGTPGYTYAWSPNVGTGPTVTNLSGATFPGSSTYNLTVTDNHGCTTTNGYNVSQPDSFTVSTNFTPSTCSNPNGTTSVTVSGATNPYTYSWNDPGGQTTATAIGLSAPAPYNCVITDAAGCIKAVTVNLTDQPGPSIDSTTAVNVTCNGFNNGVVTVYPKGGTPGFTYTWTNSSAATVGTTASVPGVTAGIYNILVHDANNCIILSTVTVTQPQPISMTSSTNMIACNGQTLGVYAAAGGGTMPYAFTWSGAGTGLVGGGNHNVVYTNTTSASVIQSYSVSVTDANNCPAVNNQFNVTVLPRITITPTNSTACNGSMGTLQAAASGGDGAPYQFTWSTGSSNSGVQSSIVVPANINQSPQTFTVTVDDGCSTTEDTTVVFTVNPNPIAGILGINLSGCTDLAVNFAGSHGGITGSTFDWSFGDNTTSTVQNPAHVYTNATSTNQVFTVQLIVTSPLGCKDTALNTGYITVYPKPVALFAAIPGSTSTLYPEVNFANSSQGAVSCAWDFGDPASAANTSSLLDPMHVYEDPGTYTIDLTATSALGCIANAQQTITVEPDYALYVPNAFSPNGDAKNEVFMPKGLGIDESRYNLYIFDRWGELIFQSNNFNTGWDGKDKGGQPVQEDVYVWKIIAFDVNSNKHNLVGHVTVVR